MTQTSRQFYPICTCATTKHTNVIFIWNVVCACCTRNARRPFAPRAFVDARRRPAALSTVAIHFLDHIPFKLLQPNTRRAQFLSFFFFFFFFFVFCFFGSGTLSSTTTTIFLRRRWNTNTTQNTLNTNRKKKVILNS